MFFTRLRPFNYYKCSKSFYQQPTSFVRENLKTFFDITIGDKIQGRITFELYAKDVPKTALNFYHLCKGDKASPEGRALSYKNSIFHRVIPGFMCQGGDILNKDGTGSISIYGNTFGDENFIYSHDKPGLLSMANRGPNSNGSQFFITTADCGWLDGKHVVFGKVLDGIQVLNNIESNGSANGKVKSEILISNCGVLE